MEKGDGEGGWRRGMEKRQALTGRSEARSTGRGERTVSTAAGLGACDGGLGWRKIRQERSQLRLAQFF